MGEDKMYYGFSLLSTLVLNLFSALVLHLAQRLSDTVSVGTIGTFWCFNEYWFRQCRVMKS